MTGALQERIVQVPGVLSQELDGEVLLLPEGSVDALHLNETATAVWLLLRNRPTLVELIAALSDANDLQPHVVSADVGHVLEELFRHGAAMRVPDQG